MKRGTFLGLMGGIVGGMFLPKKTIERDGVKPKKFERIGIKTTHFDGSVSYHVGGDIPQLWKFAELVQFRLK